ncbi:MAG: hypothetical protein N2255_10850, partial [Kiritimatiellae bacterium]|nr:hypothetical protein [Kiritimatiellia bacterium]
FGGGLGDHLAAPPPPQPQPQPQPPPPPPQPRESIVLTYKGMFRRTDGQTLILMQDSKSNKSCFYAVDKPLFGMGVGRVSEREAELVSPSGSSVTLAFGKPTTIELEGHGN